jgi:hypothetical protein
VLGNDILEPEKRLLRPSLAQSPSVLDFPRPTLNLNRETHSRHVRHEIYNARSARTSHSLGEVNPERGVTRK